MKGIDGGKGRFEVELARGWLSRYELGELRVGTAIASEGIAGKPQRAYYQGEFFMEGMIAILRTEAGRDAFCFRATSLEPGEPPSPVPIRGADAASMVPFRIVLGGADFSLAELEGTGAGTIVSLGAEWGDGYRARLRVYGSEIARGRVLVLGERFGFLVDEVSAGLSGGGEPRASGALLGAGGGAAGAKLFDFSRPDHFTRRQLESFARVHEEALAGFALRRGGEPALAMGVVDQMTLGELAAVLRGKGMALVVRTGVERGDKRGDERPRQIESPQVDYLAGEGDPFALGAAAREELRASLEASAIRDPSRPVLLAGSGSLAGFAGDSLAVDAYLGALRVGWLRYADMRFRPEDAVADPWAFADPQEMIVAVSAGDGAGGELWTAYPKPSVEGLLGALER